VRPRRFSPFESSVPLKHAITLFPSSPLKFRTVGFPQYGFKHRPRVLFQLQPSRYQFAVTFVREFSIILGSAVIRLLLSFFSLAAIGQVDGVSLTTYVQRRFAQVRLCCPHRPRYYHLIRQSARHSLFSSVIQRAFHRPDLPHFDCSSLPGCHP